MTMKLKKTLQIILALCLGLWMISCQQEHIKLTSPNGKLSLEFTLDEEGAPRYCLRHAGKNILLPSRLGLVLKYGAQNEAYMSRSAEKWVRGLCFNELGVCG